MCPFTHLGDDDRQVPTGKEKETMSKTQTGGDSLHEGSFSKETSDSVKTLAVGSRTRSLETNQVKNMFIFSK